MCKAVSDIGMAVTKAKLQVFDSATKTRKHKEVKEKVKKEKVIKHVEKVDEIDTAKTVTEDTEESVEITEIQPVEETVPTEKVDEEKAKPVITEAEHIETVELATHKKMDKKTKQTPKKKQIEPVITPHEYVVSSQQQKEETTQPFEDDYEKQKGIIKMVESGTKSVAEINELLEVINAKEFGPGESPLRELAKIGYMLRSGVTTEQIESLYDSQYFPALRIPQSQSALVQLVERQGYGALITEVLTEETAQDEDIIAAKVGFRAFLRMVEMKHSSVEEVIAHFYPEDFKPRSWEEKEAHEVFIQFAYKNS